MKKFIWKNSKLKEKKKLYRKGMAVLLCSCLFLWSCAAPAEADGSEQTDRTEEGSGETSGKAGAVPEGSVSEKVLEAGMLADCSDYYSVVTFESFSREAGACEVPIVVELHDCRDGISAQRWQLELLEKHGADLLLVDVTGKTSTEEQQELAERIAETGLPVLYFGTAPSVELLEATGGCYVGLTEEEAAEYAQVLKEERFEESGYRKKAEAAGEELLAQVLECW